MSMSTTRHLLLTALLPALIWHHAACAQVQSDAANARIQRVEQDLRVIDDTGHTGGPAQSIAQRMAALRVPGVTVAVFEEGRILWARGYGVRDVETQAPVDADTLFQAASISKPVSSAGLFRLVERGDLTLDENVNDQLRSWTLPDNTFTAVEKVTPRRIITHMAGLTGHGFAGYAQGETLPTAAQILDGAPPANSPPVRVDTRPGSVKRYSGGGFTVLQVLMEDVSGRAFADLMQTLVLQPAGMADSTFAQPLPAERTARAASGHDRNRVPVPGRYHNYPELAAAGLWTTASDLARFMLAVGASYRGESAGILDQASARTMLTKVPGGSGQGFVLAGDGEALRYEHSGGNAGFICHAVAFASSGRGVVVMTNSDAGVALTQEITLAVAREYGWPMLATGD